MEIKFGNKVVDITNEQAVSCFHALKVTLDAEEKSDGVLATLWNAMNSALVDICDHYASLARATHEIPEETDWDFVE